MARLIIVDQWLQSVEGHHSEYDLAVAQAACRLGLDVHILCNSRYRGPTQDRINFLPIFTITRGEPYRYDLDHVFRFGATPQVWPFYSDLNYGLSKLEANCEDHLFVHSIEFNEIEDLLRLAVTTKAGALPQMHILLRRDLDEIRGDKSRLKAFISAVRTLSQISPPHPPVRFYTDTDQLSSQYSSAIGIEFTTMPVPFRHDLLQAGNRVRSDSLIRLAYLGDARAEKGFNLLPGLVRSCFANADLSRARFTIQGNFNLPGGEIGICAARNQLETFPSELCLVSRDGLSEEEYYRVLAESDIILLPYDVSRYKARSSGVFYQAKAAGKLVVAPAGTQMASLLPRDSVEVYDRQRGFVATAENLIRNFDQIKEEQQLNSQYWLQATSADGLMNTLTKGNASVVASRAVKTVLYLCEAIPFWERSGSGFVVRRQLKYLQDAGYRVICVGLVNRVLRSTHEVHESFNQFSRALEDNHLEIFFKCISYLSQDTNYAWTTLEGELNRTQHFTVPTDLRAVLDVFKPDAVFFNYIFRKGYVEKLGCGSLASICEIHDLQAVQYALARGDALDLQELDIEMSMLENLSAVVSLSEIESLKVREALPSLFVRTIPPAVELPSVGWRSLAGPKDIAELLSSCSSKSHYVDFDSAWASNNLQQLKKLFEEDGVDVLFVGAHTLPNIAGLTWFCEAVLPEIVRERRVNIVIAGSIEHKRDSFAHLDNVFWAGSVADLSPLYAAAKIVILPVVDGAGINIKVTESLSYGKPVVATTFALRGIPASLGLRGYDNPDGFANELKTLLDQPELRRTVGLRNRRAAAEMSRVFSINKRMNEVMVHALGADTHVCADAIESQSEYQYLEWSQTVATVNRTISAFLEMDARLAEHLQDLYAHIGRDASRFNVLEDFIESIFIEKNAPILKTSQARFKRPVQDNQIWHTWQDVLRGMYETAFQFDFPERRPDDRTKSRHLLFVEIDSASGQSLKAQLFETAASRGLVPSSFREPPLTSVADLMDPVSDIFEKQILSCVVIRVANSDQVYSPAVFALIRALIAREVPVVASSELAWVVPTQAPTLRLVASDADLLRNVEQIVSEIITDI